MKREVTPEEEAWNQFLTNIETACADLGCTKSTEQEAWFRGHRNSEKYRLLPSLFRCFPEPNEEDDWSNARQTESDLFYEFSTRARELHEAHMSDWDILFAMQHYGTPTRLLDWTEMLGAAVYFATLHFDPEKEDTPEPCIWVLNPYRLNELSWGLEDIVYPPYLGWDEEHWDYWEYGELVAGIDYMEWDWPVAIYPRQKTDRMHAQQGWFTIHGDEHVPMEDLKTVRKRALRCITLPRSAIKQARRFLEQAGISHYSLFPDLANLSLHLKERYALKPTFEKTSPKIPAKDSGKGEKALRRGKTKRS